MECIRRRKKGEELWRVSEEKNDSVMKNEEA
jgi:hypothetical protein